MSDDGAVADAEPQRRLVVMESERTGPTVAADGPRARHIRE